MKIIVFMIIHAYQKEIWKPSANSGDHLSQDMRFFSFQLQWKQWILNDFSNSDGGQKYETLGFSLFFSSLMIGSACHLSIAIN